MFETISRVWRRSSWVGAAFDHTGRFSELTSKWLVRFAEIASLKPRLFIGSSGEGIEVARSIQEHLHRDAECSVWDQGLFELNDVTLQRFLRWSKRSTLEYLSALQMTSRR
jgi:hypothetical protein